MPRRFEQALLATSLLCATPLALAHGMEGVIQPLVIGGREFAAALDQRAVRVAEECGITLESGNWPQTMKVTAASVIAG